MKHSGRLFDISRTPRGATDPIGDDAPETDADRVRMCSPEAHRLDRLPLPRRGCVWSRRCPAPLRRCTRRSDIAVYLYRCPDHGTTEIRRAMGAAPAAITCPACGAAAARVFTAPRLSLGSPVRRALIDRTERSREQPDVVSAPPPGPGPKRRADVTRNPALSRLPRP